MSENLSTVWKKSLEPIPSHTTLSLVSLYDLLYDSTGITYTVDAQKAFKLPHDIICFNTALYGNIGGVISVGDGTDWPQDFVSNGIDISIPEYDKRANLRFVECNIKYDGSETHVFRRHGDKFGFYIKERDAALAPATITDFVTNGVKIEPGHSGGIASNYTFTSVQASGGTSSADILLTNEDTSFKGTLVTTSGLGCYNNIFLNSTILKETDGSKETDSFLLKLFIKAFDFDNISNFVTNGSNLSYKTGKISIGRWLPVYNSLKEIKGPGYEFLEKGDNLFTFLCKNTFVWVRCPFFGDYISPDSFMQDLNTDSKVKFNELILGKEQDLRMFDETLTGKESDKTKTYIPRVSPTIDLISKKYIEGENGIAENNSIIKSEETAAKIDKFLDDNIHLGNAKFKGIVASPVNRETTAELTPPNYFNKESRRDGEYYKELRKFPTVLDNDGNAYVNGRIISPTIDEIWTMLKKLVSGRTADVAAEKAIKNNYSIPLGNAEDRKNENDTTLSEVPDADFYVDDKYMDPLDYEIETNTVEGTATQELSLKVTNYVNQNDAIVYELFDKLKNLSDETTVHDTDSKYKIYSSENCLSEEENEPITKGVFAPRDVPFSLREIEALIKGNRYNIEALAAYLKYNYGAVGKLGKTTNPQIEVKDDLGITTETVDDKTNVAAGSLFQFHKEYGYDFDGEFPSTVFNKNAVTEDKGKAAVFDDIVFNGAEVRENVSDYGVTDVLPKKANDYSSADVYLAADGNWRYIFDHVRLPILKEDF